MRDAGTARVGGQSPPPAAAGQVSRCRSLNLQMEGGRRPVLVNEVATVHVAGDEFSSQLRTAPYLYTDLDSYSYLYMVTQQTTLRASVFLDKGGTGKTTSTAHLGVALQRAGYDGLLVGLAGKQMDLAKQFGIAEEWREQIDADNDLPNISTVFDSDWDKLVKMNDEETLLNKLIWETDEGIDLIPSHEGLDSLNSELANVEDRTDRYGRLKHFLDEYIDPRGYDFVLVDLPGLSNIVSYNGVWATRNIVAPAEMGPFEFEQSQMLESDVEKFCKNWSIDVELAMVMPNKFDGRRKLDEEFLSTFDNHFGQTMAPSRVPYSQDIRNALNEGRTIFALEEPSTTAKRAREAYETNATELVERLGGDR